MIMCRAQMCIRDRYKTEKEYLCMRNGEERGFTAAEFKAAQDEGLSLIHICRKRCKLLSQKRKKSCPLSQRTPCLLYTSRCV